MFCRECGTKLPDGSVYCLKCGVPLTKNSELKPPKVGNTELPLFLMVATVIGALALLALAGLIIHDNAKWCIR